LNSHPVTFKVNTGAAVTVVPAHFNKFVNDLQPTSKVLKSVGDARLKVTD